jgi:hypothetical protein
MMTFPAEDAPSLPCNRINRVDATFRESLKRVVTRSKDGKMEKSNDFTVYMAMRSIVMERVMFRARRKSSNQGGKGIIITTRTVITPTTVIISLTEAGPGFVFNVSSIPFNLSINDYLFYWLLESCPEKDLMM